MIKKIYNTIKQWLVVRWCTKWVAWCFRWLCFIARASWRFFIKHILDRLLISIIFVGGVIMLALAVRLFWKTRPIWWDGSELKNPYDLLQPLIWSIGGVGAAIGLWFANQRQKTLSEQVQTQVEQAQAQTDQSFNDRLGRGVELLAKEDMVMRCAGIRVLVNLAHNATDAQKPIVGNIIFDFFRNEASISAEDEKKRASILNKKATISIIREYEPPSALEKENRQDVQNALDFLINVDINERKKMYPNWLDNGLLNFRHLDFKHLDFSDKTLKNIDLSYSYIRDAKFDNASIENGKIDHSVIEGVNFYKVKIGHAFFWGTHINSHFLESQITDSVIKYGAIVRSRFSDVSFKKVGFYGLEFDSTDIKNSKIMDVKFGGVQFKQGTFESKNEIKVSSKDRLPHFVSTDLKLTIFDFDDKIDPRGFFDLCYYGAKQKSPKMDDSRRYDLLEGRFKVFVKSKERWSENPVDEWVNWEREEAYWRMPAEEDEENMLEQEYQEYQESRPHPREEAEQLLERGRERVKRLKEKQKKPKPKKP